MTDFFDFTTDVYTLEIRELLPDQITRAVVDPYVAAFRGGQWKEKHTHQAVVDGFRLRLATANSVFLAAFIDDVPVAGAEFLPFSSLPEKADICPAATRGSLYLNEIFVEPKVQGTGVGSLLLGGCEQAAASLSFERLSLWTHATDERLLRFYRRRGYRPITTVQPVDGSVRRTVFIKSIIKVARRAA